jgi:4-diphosphocytidyl-2-C-methyl-D-erythritol kinase
VIEHAPAKLNLCLYVGPIRDDGRHELVSVMTPLDLHDTLTLEPASTAGADEVLCAGVEGPNLAGDALRLFRERTGWDGPPVRVTIDKRTPVAAGLGGGSADAAAALRLARRHSGLGDEPLLLEIAARLGSDVPSQVRPRTTLVTGGGERVETIVPPDPSSGVLVLPSQHALSTGAVYRRFDELGEIRTHDELRRLADELRAASAAPPVNDLAAAARSLCPPIDEALDAARATGAARVMVAGSGPTVVAFYDDRASAERAAHRFSDRLPPPIIASPGG